MARRSFHRDERGMALTEYLILMALLVAGVIGSVGAFGSGLSTAWGSWTGFLPQLGRDALTASTTAAAVDIPDEPTATIETPADTGNDTPSTVKEPEKVASTHTCITLSGGRADPRCDKNKTK